MKTMQTIHTNLRGGLLGAGRILNRRRAPGTLILWVAAVWCLASSLAAAQMVGRPGDDVVDLINKMKAGDELVLSAGTYKTSKYTEIKGKHGTKDAWFTIRAVAPGAVVIQNGLKENTFNLTDCSYFRFYDLEITGKIGAVAFKWLGDNSDMIVENCYMHDMDGQAISCSSIKSMTRMRVSHCHISFTGGNAEAFYLGHQDGSAPLTDSIFECNLIHDMGGTHGSGFQGDGFDVNPGCTGNTFRYNAIYRTQCPGIGIENEKDGLPNIIEGNMVWDCLDDADIQVNANSIVKDNVVRGGKRQLVLRDKNVQASNNTVLDPNQVSSDEMLKNGLAMLATRWQEIQKTRGAKATAMLGLGKGTAGGSGDANAAMQAFLKGQKEAAGGGSSNNPTAPAGGATPAGSEPEKVAAAAGFNVERLGSLRSEAIARVVGLLKTREPMVIGLMIDKEAQQVTLMPSDVATGLLVKLSYGTKKTLAWDVVDTGTLGELLYALNGNGETESPTLGNDLMISALCGYVGNRSVMVGEELEKLAKLDPDLRESYQERARALK